MIWNNSPVWASKPRSPHLLFADPSNDDAARRVPPDLHFRRLRVEFAALQRAALRVSSADPRDLAAICQAAGLDPRCRPHEALMSHRGMRKHAPRYLARKLAPVWSASSHRHWFFCTFITDLGNALEYAPVVELARLKRDIWKMLERLDLHAIGVVELQLFRVPQGVFGRTIQAHVHAVGYTYDRALTPQRAQRRVAASGILRNWLGAKPAVLKPITSAEKLAFWCEYMFKPPLYESYLRRDSSKRSGYRTVSDSTVNQWGALRLTEILAGLTLRDATIARGELVIPKGDWHRRVAAYMRRHPTATEFDYSEHFDLAWPGYPVRRARTAPQIVRNARQPLDQGWHTAMAPRIAEVRANQARYDATQARLTRNRSPKATSHVSRNLRADVVDDL